MNTVRNESVTYSLTFNIEKKQIRKIKTKEISMVQSEIGPSNSQYMKSLASRVLQYFNAPKPRVRI
jgi:hypothetical protein